MFIRTLREFDPVDAVVFRALVGLPETRNKESLLIVVDNTAIERDAAEVSGSQLMKLGILANPSGGPYAGLNPIFTPLGRELARALGLL